MSGVATEMPLAGGNVGEVVRVGATVRRSTGPWSPAVHELLVHLESVQFPYSPRFLGIDDRGRETLSFIEGETVGDARPWPAWAWSDRVLSQVGKMLRAYHEAVATFRPSEPRAWRFTEGRVGADEVICHNDVAPYNIVVDKGEVVGLIDWDLAGPSAPEDDLAFAAWTFAPITTKRHAEALAAPADPVGRIRLLCASYGLEDRSGFLDCIAKRMLASITGIEAKAAAGEAAFTRLVRDGHLDRMKEDAQVLEAQRDCWLSEL
jgi:hypothetical protein